MSRLPTTEEVQSWHKEAIEMELCQRDYNLMTEHHPGLLDKIEAALADGVTPLQIKRWAASTVDEQALIQRCFNAARYAAATARG